MATSIIGTGTVGSTLAQLFARAGVPAQIANTRGPDSIDLDLEGITPVALDDALKADLVIAAVPFTAMGDLGSARDSWSGRTVLDVTNAFGVDPETFGGRSSAEHNADLFAGAAFVRGLNHLPYATFAKVPERGRTVVFVAGEDAEAKAEVSKLAQDLGFAPIDLGSLATGGRLLGLDGPLLMQDLVLQDS